MKKNRLEKQFLEELSNIPIVQVACEKVGLSRNTVYRWRKEYPAFAFEMDEVMNTGVEYVNDIAETQLLNYIKNGSLSAVFFWLRNHHQKYKKQRISLEELPELSQEDAESSIKKLIDYAKTDIQYEKK